MNEKLEQWAAILPKEVVNAVLMCDSAEEMKKVLDEAKIAYTEDDIALVVKALENAILPLSEDDLEKVAGGHDGCGPCLTCSKSNK